METTAPLSGDIRQPFRPSTTHVRPNYAPDKIVMISSHPEWPGRQETQSREEIAADTVHLTRVFHEVLERVKQGPVLNMEDESVTIAQMLDQIWRRFTQEDTPIRLSQMLRNARSERGVICMFLALLELVRLQAIVLRQDRNFSDILLKKNSALTG
jgi:chromatin segregation and condensation protein Rec8/ScpA/Scc1 (kleisin family)